MPLPATYQGGCHCGAIRFQVVIRQLQAIACNCSICTKKGFLHIIVPEADFTLLQGQEQLSTYTFNTGVAQHWFCSICGIHSFYRPRSHPDQIDVNLRCLEQVSMDQFEILPFDGQNWEENVNSLR